MKYTMLLASAAAAVLISACGGGETPATAQDTPAEVTPPPATDTSTLMPPPSVAELTAGTYEVDPNHAFLAFHVGHNNGLSQYTVHFTDFDATIDFNPEDVTASSVNVTIDADELSVLYSGDFAATHPNSEFDSWEADLANNDRWLNADTYPEISFSSTDVTMTGLTSGEITGDLTFLGQTRPVTLDVVFNGSASARSGADVLGFNAVTVINRSDYGMNAFIPMIGDEVEITFSGEFIGPAGE